MKTDSFVKHDRKNNQNHNNDVFEINNESTQHVIETTDEKASKSFHWDSTEFACQSDAWDMRCQ